MYNFVTHFSPGNWEWQHFVQINQEQIPALNFLLSRSQICFIIFLIMYASFLFPKPSVCSYFVHLHNRRISGKSGILRGIILVRNKGYATTQEYNLSLNQVRSSSTSSIYFEFPFFVARSCKFHKVTTQKAQPDPGLSVGSVHGSNRLNIKQVGLIQHFLLSHLCLSLVMANLNERRPITLGYLCFDTQSRKIGASQGQAEVEWYPSTTKDVALYKL